MDSIQPKKLKGIIFYGLMMLSPPFIFSVHIYAYYITLMIPLTSLGSWHQPLKLGCLTLEGSLFSYHLNNIRWEIIWKLRFTYWICYANMKYFLVFVGCFPEIYWPASFNISFKSNCKLLNLGNILCYVVLAVNEWCESDQSRLRC